MRTSLIRKRVDFQSCVSQLVVGRRVIKTGVSGTRNTVGKRLLFIFCKIFAIGALNFMAKLRLLFNFTKSLPL